MSQPDLVSPGDFDLRKVLVQRQTASSIVCLVAGLFAIACELSLLPVALIVPRSTGRDTALLSLVAAAFLTAVVAVAAGVVCYVNPRAKPTLATWGLTLAAAALIALVPAALLALWA